MNETSKLRAVFSLTVLVGALGYFVDIYDLVLFGIVRIASLRGLGVAEADIQRVGENLISTQMAGMLVGGVLWGVLGDKKGRLKVLFGSIAMYSVANLLNAFVTTTDQYAVLRFLAGFGLAGELGAAITLVSEVLPKEVRGYGTTMVAGVGVSGAVFAGIIANYLSWQATYITGGILGFGLLLLRIGVAESGMFQETSGHEVTRGSLWMLFQGWERTLRYFRCLFIGLPIWFVAGILVNFSPEFAKGLGVQGTVIAGTSVAVYYAGLIFGDFGSGFMSQVLRSRKRIVAIYLAFTVAVMLVYVFTPGLTPRGIYVLCFFLGLGTGYWAVFVTIASEQFGTNLRATVTTTAPNFVRGALPLMILAFRPLRGSIGIVSAALVVGGSCIILAFFALQGLRETHGRDLDFLES